MMDLCEAVAVLPAEHPLRRVVEFCSRDLGLSVPALVRTLEGAHAIANGLQTVEHENWIARGGIDRLMKAEIERSIGRFLVPVGEHH